MSFPPYPDYKDSGVAWLGAVPSHWEVVQGRRQFRQVREPSREVDEQLSASQRYGVIPQSRLMQLEDQKVVLALKGLEGFKHVNPDDFVISLRSFQGGIEHSLYSGCVSPAYTVLRPSREQVARFFTYALKSQSYISALQAVTDGIRDGKNISFEQFGQVGLPLPSLFEQTAIAAFLDRETAKIDGLVAEQERLIALLKEKRAAVISHAVTKGLNPNARMKDSGIEWLGEIPAHWDLGPVKRYARVLPGYAFSAADFSQDSNNWRLLRGINVSPQGLRWNEETVYWERHENDGLDGWELAAGDVVIGMDRPWIGDGIRATLVTADDLPCLLLQRVASLRAKDELDSRFLLRCFQHDAFYHHCAPDLTGVSVPHLSGGQIEEFRIPMPPGDEAHAICDFVDQKILELGELATQAQSAITLLQERRAALISAAVTGKIDVRGLVAIPDELEPA